MAYSNKTLAHDSKEIGLAAPIFYVGSRGLQSPRRPGEIVETRRPLGGLAFRLVSKHGPLASRLILPAAATLSQVSPMPIRSLTDAKHWRDRAGEARATAERMTDPDTKRIMLAIATGYERLAKRNEERQLAAAKIQIETQPSHTQS